MSESNASRSQVKLIEKLCSGNLGRRKLLQAFLKDHGITDISELALREASALIEILKKSDEGSGEGKRTPLVTEKQLQFLKKLQDSAPRRDETLDFIRAARVSSLDELSVAQASSLIDALMKLPRGKASDAPISGKQIKFIQSLIKRSENAAVLKNFLAGARKKSLDELSSGEASDLIDRLKQ